MDRRQLLFGMTALAVGTSTLNGQLNAQSTDVIKQSPVTDNPQISDREQAGLRGPVRTVSEGSTKTEYDPAGRLISSRWPASTDSQSIETRTYDGSGRLLTDTIRNGDGSLIEKVYFYDDKGRLLRIVEGSGDRTSFQYDQEGSKIEIRDVAHKSDDQDAAGAVSIDVMFADVEENSGLGLDSARNASRIKTLYDEHDQPTETQAFDGDGHLLSRIVRAYDAKRRITNVKVIIDDPNSLFPAQVKAEMLAQSDVPPDEMKAQLKKAFGAMMGESAKSYTYDSRGRRTKVILHHGLLGEVSRTYSYNDHDDVVEERTTFTKGSKAPVGVVFQLDENGNLVPEKPPSEWPPQPELPEPSVVHYTYQYDSYGNWTEQTVTRSEGSVYTRRRELTYY